MPCRVSLRRCGGEGGVCQEEHADVDYGNLELTVKYLKLQKSYHSPKITSH
jgi:hypothetical protein